MQRRAWDVSGLRRRLVVLAGTLCLGPLASSAYAHHSHPYFYDECRSITIEGRVDRVDFKDPHSWIVLSLDDGTAYTVDWAPMTRLTNNRVIGLARDALTSGARVVVTGNRIRPLAQIRERFPDYSGDVNPNTVDPSSIRRVGDDFSWALPPRANPPNCAPAAVAPQLKPPAEGRLAFEAATVKLAPPDAERNRLIPTGPNRLFIPGMTLTALIYAAYGDGGYNTSMRVTGGPDWVNKTVFSVEGIASGLATPRQLRLMLQTLLAERFALEIRGPAETADTPLNDVLALVIDRSDGTLGPKVRKWDGTCPRVMPVLYYQSARRPLQRVEDKFVVGPASETDDAAVPYCPTGYRAGGIRVDGATMVTVADMLSLPPGRALLGTVTQDRTGLTDRYTLELDYPFWTGQGAPAASPEFAGPSLPTAVREQWGLRLVPSKGRLKLITVERAQLPTGN
jgi:uncharacterized protein (TIGR03435 family)